jgi:lipoprotein-releasing system permease protein
MSVLLGCMALVVVLSLMTGLEEDLRDKILNQKAHILVSAKDGNRFADYTELVDGISDAPGVAGASAYVEGEVMAKSGMNRQGAVLLGVVPEQLTQVSNIREIVKRGSYDALNDASNIESESPLADDGTPWRLRHLEGRKQDKASESTVASPWTLGLPLGVLIIAGSIALRRRSWKLWVPPALGVAGLTALLVGLAPAEQEGGPPLPSLTEADVPADPMLERLKPKPTREGKNKTKKKAKKPSSAKKAPQKAGTNKDKAAAKVGAVAKPAASPELAVDPSLEPKGGAKGGAKVPSGGILRDIKPKGDARGPGEVVRVPDLPPVEAAPSDDDEGWEDPVEELGLDLEEPSDPAPEPIAGPDAETGAEAKSASEPQGLPDAVLIGNELAMELAVRVGSRVQLITPIGRMTPAGRVPGLLATRVGGIFYSGNYEYDRKNVYAPLPVVQAFLRSGDRVSGIEVKLDDVEEMIAGKAAIEEVLRAQGRDAELHVETWQELNKNLFSAMLLEKIAMGVALLFVVLVASFGILASNLMSVLEKAKEIAILKAMGSTDVQIQRVFVAEGLSVGLLGAIGGLSVGLGLCWALATFGFPFDENVYYIEHLPVVVNPSEVLVVGIAAMGIILLSSLYPARVAARMNPVDGLRESES